MNKKQVEPKQGVKKDTTEPGKKSVYRVTNWKEYNESLKQRGSLEIWIDNDIADKWYATKEQGRNGSPCVYSDLAFEILGRLKGCYNLKLRQLTGFMESVFVRSTTNLQVPHFSTVSRRIGEITVDLAKNPDNKDEKQIIVLDGSGLKVYGESEWKVRKHGYGKRRTWKKVHVGVNEKGDIEAVEVTGGDTHDDQVQTKLLDQIENIVKVILDGAYDNREMYDYCNKRDISCIVPPRDNAVPWEKDHFRTKALSQIKRTSLDVWKALSGYHQRSVVENTFFRFKTIFGQHLSFRSEKNQNTEILIKCSMLNKMYQLGRCISVRVDMALV